MLTFDWAGTLAAMLDRMAVVNRAFTPIRKKNRPKWTGESNLKPDRTLFSSLRRTRLSASIDIVTSIASHLACEIGVSLAAFAAAANSKDRLLS
jgi:hypothetical protein